jgi:kinesin family protein C2/C3
MSFKDSNRAGVRVLCRVRPLFDEKAQLPRSVRLIDTTTVEVADMVGGASRQFRVDAAVDEAGTTGDVFAIVRSVAQSAMSGACAAVVAYGPTGSGKTHMMHGNAREPGLVIRTAAELMTHGEVELSMIEMHNDNMLDLMLSPGHAPASLEIRNCGNGLQVVGCQKVRCTTVMALLTGIRTGLTRRQVAETKVNSKSSRSHVIVTLHVGSGNVMLIDLAGLERVKRSGAEGSVLREAQSINKSLQSLSEVVDALRRGAAHVPCRNSRLARLMSGTLGGGMETKVIVCVSPNPETRDESVAALCFAERVRRIPAAKKIVRDEQVSASEAP